ncbi:hypothetical protein ACSBR1_038671 [Camellia fascicularis]
MNLWKSFPNHCIMFVILEFYCSLLNSLGKCRLSQLPPLRDKLNSNSDGCSYAGLHDGEELLVMIVVIEASMLILCQGFDRRLIPEDYLNFVSGSVNELGDFTAELKLSLFQLGISPQIAASILMQWMGRTKRKALLAALDKIKEVVLGLLTTLLILEVISQGIPIEHWIC